MDRFSIVSAAVCGLALISTPVAAQTGTFGDAATAQPRLIKVAQPVGGMAAQNGRTAAHAPGFQRAARAMQRVRLVRELDMLRQRVIVEGLLARVEIDTDRRLADLDGIAWRFDRILEGFENGNSELGMDGVRDRKLQSQIARTRAAWTAVATVVLEVQRAGKVDDDHVKGLSAAGSWLDLEVADLVKSIEDRARAEGAVAGYPASDVVAERRKKMLQQMMAQYLIAANDDKAAETR